MLTPNQQKIDLGTIKYGKPYEFTYTLTNPTTESIKVEKLIVGCTSCTVVTMRHKTIGPGESQILNVTYTPGKTGSSKKHIQVIYGNNQDLRLDFVANVE